MDGCDERLAHKRVSIQRSVDKTKLSRNEHIEYYPSEIEVIIDSGRGLLEQCRRTGVSTRGAARVDTIEPEGTGLTSLTSSLRKTPTP